jgi:transcriptional regulator with XRE-family HTH domain
MAGRATSRKKEVSPASGKAAGARASRARTEVDESTLLTLARQLRSWTDSVLGIAGAAADASLTVAKSMLPRAGQRAAVEKAGSLLRGMREAAGLSIAELGRAIDLKDPSLLELVENGKVALPFEIILRLASILGRNDPISFVMKLTRTYNPELWKTLENLGIGRMIVQAGRERELANIYRGHDAARRLSDEGFAEVLAFTNAAFEMALTFQTRSAPRPVPARTKTTRTT